MLLDHLLARQRELGYRDGQMAAVIGIPRTSYSSIKVRRYKISLKVARKIVVAFPDLARFVLVPEPAQPPE